MSIDQLTTQADGFFCELECEGKIANQAALLKFLDNLVDYLEMNGGKVEGMSYLDKREKVFA
jgi:hypothetical protein